MSELTKDDHDSFGENMKRIGMLSIALVGAACIALSGCGKSTADAVALYQFEQAEYDKVAKGLEAAKTLKAMDHQVLAKIKGLQISTEILKTKHREPSPTELKDAIAEALKSDSEYVAKMAKDDALISKLKQAFDAQSKKLETARKAVEAIRP